MSRTDLSRDASVACIEHNIEEFEGFFFFKKNHLISSCNSGINCVHPNATKWNSDSIILSKMIIYIHVTRVLFVYNL